jgi:hypothetical protein
MSEKQGVKTSRPTFTFSDVPDLDDEDEAEVGLAPLSAPTSALPMIGVKPAVDLSGRAKVWFLIGRGRSGKTTCARWVCETVTARGGDVSVAALDQGGRRGLADYLQGVRQPPTGDATAGATWAERWLQFCMASKRSGLGDFGGGDTILPRVLAAAPDLVETMEAAEVSPVAVYLVGPSPADLGPMATLEAAGFRPTATLVVANEGLADPSLQRADFARVLKHSAFREVIQRGGQVAWMPRLEPRVAADLEAKRLTFVAAGGPSAPLAPFDAARVRFWSKAMAEQFDRVRSWVP